MNVLGQISGKKNPTISDRVFGIKAWRCPTLTWGDPTLPSALNRFTSEFEMGSGGSNSLLPPDKLVGHFTLLLQNIRNWKAKYILLLLHSRVTHFIVLSAALANCLGLYGQASRSISTG